MTDSSPLSNQNLSNQNLSNTKPTSNRRSPKQQRGKDRVDKILNAAAEVFDQVGYAAATTHMIAAKAETAIGSLYQFFPDKAAIFKAMEQRHIENVQALWTSWDDLDVAKISLRDMIQALTRAVSVLFENPVSRVIFVQFFVAREAFQTIDESMTYEAIGVMANLLKRRNPNLDDTKCALLAEVCVISSNALNLNALQSAPEHQQQIRQQIEDLMVAYLEPYVGDRAIGDVMKVMKSPGLACPHCEAIDISKNGKRRGKQCYLCKHCGKQFVSGKSH
jgi:AcrR family transcriptional regulator